MNPQTVQKLTENVPEFKELIVFLATELAKLNDVTSLKDIPRGERQIALEGRLWAHAAISAMLTPLLRGGDKPLGTSPEEYVV